MMKKNKMNKNKDVKNKLFIKKDEPLFDPHQFHLYFTRRIDDLIKLEVSAMFQRSFWEMPY